MSQELTRHVNFMESEERVQQLHRIAREKEITVSLLLRTLVRDFLRSQSSYKNDPDRLHPTDSLAVLK